MSYQRRNSRNSETFDLIINTLKKNGAMFRGELVDKTGLPRSTLYDNLRYLMDRDVVVSYGAKREIGAMGRSKVLFHYMGDKG